MKSPIKPLGEKVVAHKKQPKTQTDGGILLGKSEEKPVSAEILAVGEKVKAVKAGDEILYKEYSATDLKIGSDTFLIIDEEDIFRILEDK